MGSFEVKISGLVDLHDSCVTEAVLGGQGDRGVARRPRPGQGGGDRLEGGDWRAEEAAGDDGEGKANHVSPFKASSSDNKPQKIFSHRRPEEFN